MKGILLVIFVFASIVSANAYGPTVGVSDAFGYSNNGGALFAEIDLKYISFGVEGGSVDTATSGSYTYFAPYISLNIKDGIGVDGYYFKLGYLDTNGEYDAGTYVDSGTTWTLSTFGDDYIDPITAWLYGIEEEDRIPPTILLLGLGYKVHNVEKGHRMFYLSLSVHFE
jgi:hypothetical protein